MLEISATAHLEDEPQPAGRRVVEAVEQLAGVRMLHVAEHLHLTLKQLGLVGFELPTHLRPELGVGSLAFHRDHLDGHLGTVLLSGAAEHDAACASAELALDVVQRAELRRRHADLDGVHPSGLRVASNTIGSPRARSKSSATSRITRWSRRLRPRELTGKRAEALAALHSRLPPMLVVAASISLVAAVRTRREIRTLTQMERDRIFSAFEVMHDTAQEKGEALYGPRFRTYQSIVLQHMYATIDHRCDQGHLSAAFFMFHRLLVLAVEESLLAIDERIEALPYWDYNLDLKLKDSSASTVWTDGFFGEFEGDADDGWQIRTGPWKDWLVDSGSWFTGPPRFDISRNATVHGVRGNAYGYLRGPTNQNPAARLTRRNAICGSALPWFGGGVTNATWSTCLAHDRYMAFYGCFDAGLNGPHPFAHIWLGGAWGARDGNCTAKQLDTASAELVGGCLTVPNCTGLELEDCVLTRNETACAAMDAKGADCQRYGGGSGRPSYAPDAPCKRCGAACSDAQFGAAGDFWDGSTSPNDPVFWFHHPNIDRALVIWQRAHAADAPFYDYPTRGYCPGHNLGDVISSSYPFPGWLVGLTGENATEPLTAAALLAHTQPGMIYTYDRL